ncbi:MAG: YigZ family protein [Clostridia bacterium]|nr:YigZ family protein [Clostridia bacterium]
MERYRTIKKSGHAELTEKKSVFIGDAAHVESEEEARAFIEEKRRAYRDARHIVFAYVVGNTMRYSDDGEPQGTGGPPVLDVIKKNGLTGVVITVVRIFGGILLGAGGLTRAYSGSAAEAVANAHCAFFEEYAEYELEIEYGEYQKLLYEITAAGGEMTSSEFGSGVVLRFASPSRISERICKKVVAATNGKRTPGLKRTYFDEEKQK